MYIYNNSPSWEFLFLTKIDICKYKNCHQGTFTQLDKIKATLQQNYGMHKTVDNIFHIKQIITHLYKIASLSKLDSELHNISAQAVRNLNDPNDTESNTDLRNLTSEKGLSNSS